MSGKSYRTVMDEARRVAADMNIDPGTISPGKRRFTLLESIDHHDSFTLSRRTATGREQVCSFHRSPSHQTTVTSNALGFQAEAADRTLSGTSSDEVLIMTGVGQLVARVQLLVPIDEFHGLLAPDGADPTTSRLRIVNAVTGPSTVFNPAPGIPIVALQSLTSHITETTLHGRSLQITPTPPSRRKAKPEKEKDWNKAAEKPEGSTKLESDSCLTCIQNDRCCEGTDLVLIRGEFRCKKCAEKHTTTGTRRCFWKDAANNVFTYQEARAAAGYKALFGNTREGIAERKARKEREGREALEAEANANAEDEEMEDQGETCKEEEEDDEEVAFNSAVDTAWQRLYEIAVATDGLDLNDNVTNVNMLGMMRVMLANNEDQWHFDNDVVSAIEARLRERTARLEAMIREELDLEAPLTWTEARCHDSDTAVPGVVVDNNNNQSTVGSAHGSAGQDSRCASETAYDAEDDLTTDESPTNDTDQHGEVTCH